MPILQAMGARGARRTMISTGISAAEVGRFAVTGAVAYLVDVLVFNTALLLAQTGPLTAKLLSSGAAIVVAYLGSRYCTWPGRPRVAHPVLTFTVVSVLAAAVQICCLWVSHDLVGWTSPTADNISANVVGMGLATAVRFWAFRSLVFVGAPDPDVTAVQGARS